MVRVVYKVREQPVVTIVEDDWGVISRTLVSLTDDGDVYGEKVLPPFWIAV